MRGEAPPRVLAGVTGIARALSRAPGPSEVKTPLRARMPVQTMALGEELARAGS
jgi:hypothetical protein